MKMSSSVRAREGNNSADRNFACREIKREKKPDQKVGGTGLSVEAPHVTQSGPKERVINDLLPEQSDQQKGSESCFRKEQVLPKKKKKETSKPLNYNIINTFLVMYNRSLLDERTHTLTNPAVNSPLSLVRRKNTAAKR